MSSKSKHDYEMKGCVCKKFSSPYLYAEITYKQPDGTIKRISRSTRCKRKYDAMRRMEQMIAELERDLKSAEKGFHELTQFINYWLEKVESKEIEATTLETYRMHFKAYIKPFFTLLDLSVEELRPAHLWDFVEYMQSQTTQKGTPMKTCSIKKVLSNIKLAMDYAMKKEMIEMNPVEAIKLKTKRKEKFTHSFYTIQQLMQLWQAAKGTLYEPAIVLASIYGLRRGEISGLKWDRIDFKRQSIRIEETVVYAGAKPYIKDTKTEASMRTMPIISPVKKYLLRILTAQREKAAELGSAWADSGYVIVDEFGEALRPMRVSNNFKKLLEDNDLPHIRFHDLRHSVATYMLGMGVPIAEISAWLGHKSVSTTSNIYAHVTDEMRDNAARWMDASYDPDNDDGKAKITLDQAIQKLFDSILCENKDESEETRNARNETRKRDKNTSEPHYHQKEQDEHGRDHEQIEEKPRLRVLRGKTA